MEAAEMAAEIELPRPPASSAAPQAVVQQRLIRTGSARVEVRDLDAAVEATEALVQRVEGYVAGSEVTEGREGARTASMNLRVPADAFDEVVDGLPTIGRVMAVSIHAQDVSRDYFDVETRLAVKEETVDRLRELASRGGDLEDLLAAERELGRAMTELESLRGQIRYYDQRIAESDLSLTLVEPGAVVSSGAFRPVVEAFRDATAVFARSIAALVYIVVFAAPWVLLASALWLLGRSWRRARTERAAGPSES